MSKITKVKTGNRDEWLALRNKYIGGSDAAAVIGLNRFSSPYAVWAEKTGKIPGFSGNLATEVGAYLEEFVAKQFEKETGKKVRRVNQSILNSTYPFAIANIDREIVGEDAGLEIKTTSELNLKRFKNGEYPENYYAQCVHYLAVTGRRKWYLAVLIGNRDFKWFEIERDEGEIADLMAMEAEFWECVKSDTPPGIDGTSATTEAIKTIYTDSGENSVDLYGCDSVLDQYMALGDRIRELEQQREEYANKVKQYMGEAGSGESDRYRVSWKSSIRRTFDNKRFLSDHPEIDVSGYYKETDTRVFRVAEIKQRS